MSKNDFVNTTVEIVGDMAVTYLLTCVGGQIIKTAITYKKLSDCGKGAKMATEFTKNAQKANWIKTCKKAAMSSGVKATSDIIGHYVDKKNYNNDVTYIYDVEDKETKEEICIKRIKNLMSIGNMTRTDAIDYVKETLFINEYSEPIALMKAINFVDNIK